MTDYQETMANLLRTSQPPEGVADNYPFNAAAWVRVLFVEWEADGPRSVEYIYHQERMPDFSILP